MIYEGKAISVKQLEHGIAELCFDLQDESINKFNQATLQELAQATTAIKEDDSVTGVIVTSAKDAFIVGADITEFTGIFNHPDEQILEWVLKANSIFNNFEDLEVPTVIAINGLALGGGFEMCLAGDYRVMSTQAKVGLPEVKLGIFPGFGGTVRLSRLVGSDNAIEWICTGKDQRPDTALKVGAVDAVVAPDKLRESALATVKRCISGELDYKAKRQEKLEPLQLGPMDAMLAFESAKGFVAQQAGPHYPAPLAAIGAIQKHAGKKRDQAIEIEAKNFVKMAKTDVALALIGLFLNDQVLKKQAKKYAEMAKQVNRAAVLGAGIMGGGIAYQSAYKGTPILMKDINPEGIDLGLAEAQKLLVKRVDRGRMDAAKMGEVLNRIQPTLSYGDFASVDLVVEAVVENLKVKHAVLAEVEGHIGEDKVLTSNTSTISITKLAEPLKRPENFCGMHFFNPVHMMPLVEVIRGEKTSEQTIATVVKYVSSLGKTPIVVNDCPGFLVNRILFPYFGGFAMLLRDGADFQQIDKVMERFGWPMGPAYLLDVVGIDTGVHAQGVMAEGFPDRMEQTFKSGIEVMYDNKRFGQKNSQGFYKYELDRKGKPKKIVDDAAYNLLAPHCAESKTFTDEEIIERMMIPLCLETVRCLEDGIVESAVDADMGLIYGIGFPPFRGGALRYIDHIGVANFVAMAEKYADLGGLYAVTDKLREMAAAGQTFFGK